MLTKTLVPLYTSYSNRVMAKHCVLYEPADALRISPHKPRTSGRQIHRANAANSLTSAAKHYRINLFLSFIDYILVHLNEWSPAQLIPCSDDGMTIDSVKWL